MTLANLLHNAQASVEVPDSLKSLKVEESDSVCPISFYPWLKSAAFTEIISELGESNLSSDTILYFDRSDSGYKVTVKGGLKKMDGALKLVYMTDDEIKKAEENGERIVKLSAKTRKDIANAFCGGYISGTAATGYSPTAITLAKKTEDA